MRLWKKGVVEGDAVKGKNGLYEVVKAYGLNKRSTMIVDFRLAALCYLFAQDTRQLIVHPVCPYTNRSCPLLYDSFLLRSALALSLELAECWRIRAICANFCSREQGCNDICCTSRCAAILFVR